MHEVNFNECTVGVRGATATARGTAMAVRGSDVICCVSFLERSDLSHIGTHVGRRPMETHVNKGEETGNGRT